MANQNNRVIVHPIEGKVARIINARELVINVGKVHGVKVDMVFKVLADNPLDILDPDTGEILGKVQRDKVRVRVFEVQEKISVCTTYRKIPGTPALARLPAASLSSIFMGTPDTTETLRASDDSYPPPISEDESYVKKGDLVREVLPSKPDNE